MKIIRMVLLEVKDVPVIYMAKLILMVTWLLLPRVIFAIVTVTPTMAHQKNVENVIQTVIVHVMNASLLVIHAKAVIVVTVALMAVLSVILQHVVLGLVLNAIVHQEEQVHALHVIAHQEEQVHVLHAIAQSAV